MNNTEYALLGSDNNFPKESNKDVVKRVHDRWRSFPRVKGETIDILEKLESCCAFENNRGMIEGAKLIIASIDDMEREDRLSHVPEEIT